MDKYITDHFTNYARCPKCGAAEVYHQHTLSHKNGDTHNIQCGRCGLTTDIYPTYKQAHAAWESLKKEVNTK